MPIIKLALFVGRRNIPFLFLPARDRSLSFHFPLDLTDGGREDERRDGHYNGRLSLKAISINCSSKRRPTEAADPLGKMTVYWKLSFTFACFCANLIAFTSDGYQIGPFVLY